MATIHGAKHCEALHKKGLGSLLKCGNSPSAVCVTWWRVVVTGIDRGATRSLQRCSLRSSGRTVAAASGLA